MAKKLDTLPIIPHGRSASYPWHEWLDGNIWQLERGTDFTSEASVMQTYVLRKVKNAGLAGKLKVIRRGNVIFITPRG